MAGKDKHPPLDPNRHSTNKRVKPLGENLFGTPYLTAEGSKRVKPGDPNTTGAKVQGPSETARQRWDREEAERRQVKEDKLQKNESFISSVRSQLLKRGWMSQTEMELLKIGKGKSQRS